MNGEYLFFLESPSDLGATILTHFYQWEEARDTYRAWLALIDAGSVTGIEIRLYRNVGAKDERVNLGPIADSSNIGRFKKLPRACPDADPTVTATLAEVTA